MISTPGVTNVGGLDDTVSVICTHENDHSRRSVYRLDSWGGQTARRWGVPAVLARITRPSASAQKVPMAHGPSCINPLPQPTPHACRVTPGGYVDGSGTHRCAELRARRRRR